MDKIFFANTYIDYHTNGTNRAYWAKYFREIKEKLGDEYKMHLNSSFNEYMPIYEYYSDKKTRFVRIMQYNPKDDIIAEEKYPAKRFFTAWTDKRVLLLNEEEWMKPELVVCLLMTFENLQRAIDLIHTWFFEPDEIIEQKIERIYREQELMDEEIER